MLLFNERSFRGPKMIKYLHSTRHIVNPVLRRQLSTAAGTNGLDFVVKKPGIKANVIDGNILAKRVGLDQCVSDSLHPLDTEGVV